MAYESANHNKIQDVLVGKVICPIFVDTHNRDSFSLPP